MTMVDTNSDTSIQVRVNHSGRRTFSPDYKAELVEQCLAPGASVAAIALSHRINANQVRKWIVQHRAGRLDRKQSTMPAVMLPVTLDGAVAVSPTTRSEPAASRSTPGAAGVIEVQFDGARLRVRGAVDAAALQTVIEVLTKR